MSGQTATGTVLEAGLKMTAAHSRTPLKGNEANPKLATAESRFHTVELEVPPQATGTSATITLSQSSSLHSLPTPVTAGRGVNVDSNPRESMTSETEETFTFTTPLDDCDRNPETTVEAVVTPYVSIESSEPFSSTESIKVTLPHSAVVSRNPTALVSTLPILPDHELYRLVVKRQSVDFEGKVGNWELVEEVLRFQGKIVACVDSLTKLSVFVGIAQSNDGRPIGQILSKQAEVWILSSPYVDQKLFTRVVITTSAFSPSEFEEEFPNRIRSDNALKLLEGPQHLIVDLDKNVRLSMSVRDKTTALTFQPQHHYVSKRALISSDTFNYVSFVLPGCDHLALTQPHCECVVDQLSSQEESVESPPMDGAQKLRVVFDLPRQTPSVSVVSSFLSQSCSFIDFVYRLTSVAFVVLTAVFYNFLTYMRRGSS